MTTGQLEATTSSRESARWKGGRTLLIIFLVLASAEFVVRGPVRFVRARSFNDFISPYIQTRAWMKGMDPYSPRNLVALWPADAEKAVFLTRDLADGSLVMKRGIPTAYPPTSFVLLSTVAWLPWRVAYPVWLAISLLAYAATVFSLASIIGLRWLEWRTYLFLALALALAPFHTGLAAGSIVIVAVGACALAVWAAARQGSARAGILLGVAVALKPQIGLPFLVYYLLRGRWRILAPAVVVIAILAGAAIFYLASNHTPWVDCYRYDNKVLFASGSLGDFTERNPIRFGLINLQVLTYLFLSDRGMANVLALVIAGAMGVMWLMLLRRGGGRNELLDLSALTVLSLLPVYHRLYDASLLIFPLAWSLTAWSSRLGPLAKGILLLTLIFLVPGGSALEQLQHTNFNVALQHSWWWMRFVMTHQVWALLFLSVILLEAMRASAAETQNPPRERG